MQARKAKKNKNDNTTSPAPEQPAVQPEASGLKQKLAMDNIYLPSVLIFQVLRTAHDDLGHNGFPRTYAALK